MVIMRGRKRWLGNILRMKDTRFPKIVLVGQPSKAKQKAQGLEGYCKDRFKGNSNFLERFKEGGFEQIGMEEEHA